MSLLSKNLEQLKAASGYQFSATKIDNKILGSSQYTLATVVVDTSGSVSAFLPDLNKCLKSVFLAMHKSNQVDMLMFRVVSFDDQVTERHGFKLLTDG